MSFEEDFLIAVAADDDKQKRNKKKPLQGSGCMIAVLTILLVIALPGLLCIY